VRRLHPLAPAAVFAVLAVVSTGVVYATGHQISDLEVYRDYGDAMRSGLVPYRDFDVEYPPGSLLLFLLPSLVTSDPEQHYALTAGLLALVGAAGVHLTASTMRRLGRSTQATQRVSWLLALSPVLFAGVLLTRFDLLPATLVACATAVLVAGRGRLAAAVLGAAVAVKLYPLVLLPILVTWAWRRRGAREAVVCAGVALGVTAVVFAPFLVLSPGGVVDSVAGQLGRPLQIETLGAGVLVLVHNAAGLPLETGSSYGSASVVGGAASTVAVTSSLAQIAVLAWLWLRYARGWPTAERTVRYGAAALVTFVVVGKVLSPQFLVWLLFAVPLVAGARGVRAGTFYALAALTTAIWFPALYQDLDRDQEPAIALLVVVRALLLIAALVVLVWPRPALSPATAPARDRSRSPSLSPRHR
jgi:hypothetical protein